jgi:hypothetical protein
LFWYDVNYGRGTEEDNLVDITHRWEDDIKMDLEEMGWGTWTLLARVRIGTGSGHL